MRRLGDRQFNALYDVARAPGLFNSAWQPDTLRALERRGLVELRFIGPFGETGGWHATEAGIAAVNAEYREAAEGDATDADG
jgi:hypothetical protein